MVIGDRCVTDGDEISAGIQHCTNIATLWIPSVIVMATPSLPP